MVEHYWSLCLDWHRHNKMPLFAWSCLALRFFSGKYRQIDQMTNDEFKQLMSDRWTADVVRVYYSPRNLERLARADKLAHEFGVTTTQIALAWVLNQGDHVYAVAGPRSVHEIKELFQALAIKLTPQQVAWLNLEQ